MSRRAHDLFPAIASFAALREAALKAARGKRHTPGAAAFMANLEKNLLRIERALLEGRWQSGGYTEIELTDPKRRIVTFVAPTSQAAEFLGYVLLPGDRRRLPEANVRRFRNRLRGLRDRWRAGTVDADAVQQHVQAWIAHAENADTWRLRHTLFRGGWFDPLREPDGPPDGRVVRGGSWNNNARNLRAANRNNNSPGNRNNNNGFRLASTPSRAGAAFPMGAAGVPEGVHGPS